jgi:hypothetical protein
MLDEVGAGTQLTELVDDARVGKFGDAPDWDAAESRWFAAGVRVADMEHWARGGRHDIASVGAPGFSVEFLERGEPHDRTAQILLDLYEVASSAQKKADILGRVATMMRSRPISHNVLERIWRLGLGEFKAGSVSRTRLVSLARSLPKQPELRGEAVEALEKVGREEGANLSLESTTWTPDEYLKEFIRDNSLRGLLPFLLPIPRGKMEAQHGYIKRIPKIAFESMPDDTVPIQGSVAQLRLFAGYCTEADVAGLVETIAAATRPGRWANALLTILRSALVPNPLAISVLNAAFERAHKLNDTRQLWRIAGALKSKLDTRPSRLRDSAIAHELDLPAYSTGL